MPSRRHWRVAPDAEITLEANPTSVEATRFRGYRTAGVNRVSLGVQALDDRVLTELGRMHTAREALDAVAIARTVFGRYSFDLIYARPRQAAAGLGQRTEAARWPKPASICRSISSPSSPRRRSPRSMRPASCKCRTMTPRGRFTTPPRRFARRTACRPMRFPIMPGRAANAGTIWSIGGPTNMPASAPALMAGSTSTASGMPPPPKSGRKPGWRVEAHGHGLVTDDVLTREERSDEFLLMGLRLAEGIDIARAVSAGARPGRALDMPIETIGPSLHDPCGFGLDAHRPRPTGRSARSPLRAAFRCSMRWSHPSSHAKADDPVIDEPFAFTGAPPARGMTRQGLRSAPGLLD